MVDAISNGNPVHVRAADKDDSFECQHCHDEVRPVQGSTMPWHYRHVEKNDCIGTTDNPSGVGD